MCLPFLVYTAQRKQALAKLEKEKEFLTKVVKKMIHITAKESKYLNIEEEKLKPK